MDFFNFGKVKLTSVVNGLIYFPYSCATVLKKSNYCTYLKTFDEISTIKIMS